MGWLLAIFKLLGGLFGFIQVQQERQAGAAENQVEANRAEIDRINRAADAGAAAGGVPDNGTDPNNRDGK